MIDAPQCPDGCGPFLLPFDDRRTRHVFCAACGVQFDEVAQDVYDLACRAEDEYLGAEELRTTANEDRKALTDWEAWAKQPHFGRAS